MGRTMKRVPLDFAWPLNTTWGGYLNPFYRQPVDCPSCNGSGLSREGQLFSDQWYGDAPFDPAEYGANPISVDHPSICGVAERNVARSPGYYGSGHRAVEREKARLFELYRAQWSCHLIRDDVEALVADGRLWDFTRRPHTPEQEEKLAKTGKYWLEAPNGHIPTADEVNAWHIATLGHDSINQGICVEARCKREGVPHMCGVCHGEGEMWPSEAIKQAAEDWNPTEPPAGPGFQLWETTSEGSPVSPVFETIEALCTWCAGNATTFGSARASAEEWRRMLDADFVCHREGDAVFL